MLGGGFSFHPNYFATLGHVPGCLPSCHIMGPCFVMSLAACPCTMTSGLMIGHCQPRLNIGAQRSLQYLDTLGHVPGCVRCAMAGLLANVP